MDLSKTISQYIGSSLVSYIVFLIATIVISIFLIDLSKRMKLQSAKIAFLAFTVSFIGLAIFPYDLFGDTISSIHQIFADLAFIASLAFALISSFARKTKSMTIIFITYSAAFILAYIFKIAPFCSTELIWESLYFVLFSLVMFQIKNSINNNNEENKRSTTPMA